MNIELTNFHKHILVFIAMITAVVLLGYFDMDLYKQVFMAAGGWQIGQWCQEFAQKRWPREE